MLVIRQAQLNALGRAREAAFRHRLLRYARRECGARYAGTDDAGVLDTIEWAMKRGLRAGVHRPPDLERFVRFVLREGRDFEETLAGASAVLKRPGGNGRSRLEALEALAAEAGR